VSDHWSDWRPGAPAHTVGVEEELMVLGGQRLQLEPAGPRAAEALPPHLRAVVSIETHASALEVHTSVQARIGDAAAELAGLRAELAGELEALGLRAASAGTHPLSLGLDTTVSPQDRYQHLYRALGELARREPTFALHVHVGLPTADAALAAYDRLRCAVPLLIGLSANSPFWRGRDSGLASARTFVFGAFPRTGLPRAFASYEDYVGALDALIAAGAIPDHTFVWWDLRLQPHLGTIEIRAMDAQVEVWQTAALTALVQCLVRAGAEEGPGLAPPPEVLDENRFIAARDGAGARLIEDGRPTPLPALLDGMLARLAPHAEDLGCVAELEAAAELARENGAARQRRAAAELGVSGIAGALADAYAAPASGGVVRSGTAPSAG
jgi:carboxylate-amine ligase